MKHIFLSYHQPKQILTTIVILALLLLTLYIYLGRMTFTLWVLSAGIVIAFVQALRQLSDRGPSIIITDEGINDKRLRMGMIRWADIERVRMNGLGRASFISLELSNRDQYLSRQPLYLRMTNQIWRLYNISPINIKVDYMDVTPDELFELIISEVELNRSRS